MSNVSVSAAQEDLRAVWKPTAAQVKAAESRMRATGETEVYSAQVLVGKAYATWVAGAVTVKRAPGKLVYGTRAAAMEACVAGAKTVSKETRVPCTGGWARHTPGGQWAVWEDPCSAADDGAPTEQELNAAWGV